MKIINLGHASFMLKNDEVSIAIDPYQNGSVPNLKFPKVKANFAFKSHDHHDHNALELIEIVPTDKQIKYETIVVPHDHHNGEHRGLNKIHIFYIDGLKVVHTGDLGCVPSQEILEKLKEVDVLLAPINGFYTISAQELFDICQIIKPRLVIPMHYYKKDDNSGYPDGGQIEKFKTLFPNYLEVNDYSVEINNNLFDNKVLIFVKALQEGK